MKKLFIWCTELEVFVAIADSVEEAINLLIEQGKKNEEEWEPLWDNWGKVSDRMANTPEWEALHKYREIERKTALGEDGLEYITNNPPDFTFDTNISQAYLIEHANE